MKLGLQIVITFAIVLVGMKAVDMCLDGFDYSTYPGQDVLSLLGLVIVVFLSVMAMVYIWIPNRR